MTNSTKTLNTEENRLTISRRALIAGMTRVESRLEARSFALSDEDAKLLNHQLETLQQRLGDINDRLHDIQVKKAHRWVSAFKVSFPDIENPGKRITQVA